MLKKLFRTTRSGVRSYRHRVRQKISARSLRMNRWLQEQTASMLPGHRKIYSIAMLLLLTLATLWNIYIIITKNHHV